MTFKTHDDYGDRVDAKMDYVKVQQLLRAIKNYIEMLEDEMDKSVTGGKECERKY